MARTRNKAKDLLTKSTYEVVKAARAGESRDIFRALKNSLDSRIRTYTKAGAKDKLPKAIKNITGVRGKSEEAIIKDIRSMMTFMSDTERGTYKQYRKTIDERKSAMEDYINRMREREMDVDEEFSFEDDEDYSAFGNFMGDMQSRYGSGEMWKEVSGESAALFAEGKRLGLDPNQFLRNYDYWVDHLKDLESADPIQTGRKLYPSDYARKLNLPKISGGPRRRRS